MQVPEFVRRVTDPLLGGVRVPILSGVNQGRWWSAISAGAGYGSGRRANAQMELLASLLKPGDVVWDVGAHQGFVTLCAARCVGPAGAVHAFEPSARNRAILRRHVRWNRLSNVTVHPFALSDYEGESSFGGGDTSKMHALGAGPEVVRVRTAASLVADGTCPPPTFMKVDVEGAEGDTLAGAMSALPGAARLLIAVHGTEADRRCTALLSAAGFALLPSRALEQCRRGEWRSDPDLYCAGPDAPTGAREMELLRTARF